MSHTKNLTPMPAHQLLVETYKAEPTKLSTLQTRVMAAVVQGLSLNGEYFVMESAGQGKKILPLPSQETKGG